MGVTSRCGARPCAVRWRTLIPTMSLLAWQRGTCVTLTSVRTAIVRYTAWDKTTSVDKLEVTLPPTMHAGHYGWATPTLTFRRVEPVVESHHSQSAIL